MNHRLLTYLFLLLNLSYHALSQGHGTLVDHVTHVTASTGEITKEESYLFQINDKDSQWLGEVSVPQYGSKVHIVEANIQSLDGTIVRKLKRKEIIQKADVSDFALHEDDLVKTFSLVHHIFPYRIFYKTRTSFKEYLSVTRWTPIKFYGVETKHAKLTVDLKDGFEVQMDYSENLTFKTESILNDARHTWEISNLSAIEKNSYAPPLGEVIPWVSVIPSEFHYGVQGSARTWSELGKWESDLIAGLDNLPPEEVLKVKELTKGLTDKKLIIETLYKYLQDNHRYIYVGIDIGGHKPYPASYVTKNRYGDCKALTNYMKSALSEVNIPSYYTTIYAGENPVRVNTGLPSQQANHVILCVPIEEDTVWLENTSNWHPANYLGTFTQDRYALLANGEESSLVKTPALSETDVLNKYTYHIDLVDIEVPTCKLEAQLGGEAYDDLNYLERNSSKQRQTSFIKNRLIPFESFSITDWELCRQAEKNVHSGFKAHLELQNFVRKLANTYALPIPKVGFKLGERSEKRTHPVRFNYPIHQQDSIVYQLTNEHIGDLKTPNSFNLESEFGEYKISFLKTENLVVVKRLFLLKKGNYALEKYPELYNFIDQIHKKENSFYILTNSQ
ncbi:MAG: transglutaminase family protein [Cyclobacteriaceae bacterium]